MAGVIMLVSLVALLVGLIAIIRPMPRLRLAKRRHGLGLAICSLFAFAVAASFLPDPTPPAAAAPSSAPQVVEAASSAAPPSIEDADYLRRWAASTAAYRAHAPASLPALGVCEDGAKGAACRLAQYGWATHDWAAAHRGDIDAIREVALCLSTSCDGAIFPNRVQGCAWRLMVIGSGAAVVDETDTDHAQQECGALDKLTRGAAANRAAEIADRTPHLFEPE